MLGGVSLLSNMLLFGVSIGAWVLVDEECHISVRESRWDG
jgi:hypothetical protein